MYESRRLTFVSKYIYISNFFKYFDRDVKTENRGKYDFNPPWSYKYMFLLSPVEDQSFFLLSSWKFSSSHFVWLELSLGLCSLLTLFLIIQIYYFWVDIYITSRHLKLLTVYFYKVSLFGFRLVFIFFLSLLMIVVCSFTFVIISEEISNSMYCTLFVFLSKHFSYKEAICFKRLPTPEIFLYFVL